MSVCISLLSHACYVPCQRPAMNCYLEHGLLIYKFHLKKEWAHISIFYGLFYHVDNGTPGWKFYCWHLHIGQQYKGNTSLPFCSNNYANTPQCFAIHTSSTLFYLTRCTTYSIAICHLLCTNNDNVGRCHVTTMHKISYPYLTIWTQINYLRTDW